MKNHQLFQIVKGSIEASLLENLEDLKSSLDLYEAASYMLSGGGKRLRPLISLYTYLDLTKASDFSAILSSATALEYLHCASLIHDDLPALDNDDFRRGQPSCHKKFSEATAILTGDALISLAFRCVSESSLSDHAKLRIINRVSQAWSTLCVGQSLDLEHSETVEDLLNVHQKKTGALMSCAFAVGAECFGLNCNQVSLFDQLGNAAGILFQLTDDLTDQTGMTEKGRPTGSDTRNLKPAFLLLQSQPHIYQDLIEKYTKEVFDLLSQIETEFTEDGTRISLENIRALMNEFFFKDENKQKAVGF